MYEDLADELLARFEEAAHNHYMEPSNAKHTERYERLRKEVLKHIRRES